jgi:hypothetical protein
MLDDLVGIALDHRVALRERAIGVATLPAQTLVGLRALGRGTLVVDGHDGAHLTTARDVHAWQRSTAAKGRARRARSH